MISTLHVRTYLNLEPKNQYNLELCVAFRQSGLSGQKPKHAPFCMKGAATHT